MNIQKALRCRDFVNKLNEGYRIEKGNINIRNCVHRTRMSIRLHITEWAQNNNDTKI